MNALLRAFPLFMLALMAASVGADTPQEAAPVKQTLPDGATIIVRQETATPLVAIDAFIRVGAGQETSDKAGLGSYVARTLLASTQSRSPDRMAHDIGALGGSVNATWNVDWTQLSALTVKDKFGDAARLVMDALSNATFDPNAVSDARQQALSEIDASDAGIFQLGYGSLRRSLYAGSGYALPALGTSGTVRRIQQRDLLDYYHQYYTPKNLVLVVVGNVAPADAIRALTQGLQDMDDPSRGAARRASTPEPPPMPVADLPTVRRSVPGLAETLIIVGYRAAPESSPDYAPMLVANALLGGMKSSRLFVNLREKQGLAYDLGSAYSAQDSTGDLVAFAFAPIRTAQTANAPTAGQVKAQILSQFAALREAPPTPAELSRAQHFLVGSYLIKHERLEDRATLLGIAELTRAEGYLWDTDYARYIGAVTAADVQRVAAKYFTHPGVSVVEPDAKEGALTAE